MFFGVDSLFVTNNYNMYVSGNKTLNKCMHYIRLLGLKTHYKCLIIELLVFGVVFCFCFDVFWGGFSFCYK